MQTAFELGVDAASVIAYAFETLSPADRIVLAERLVKYSTPECVIGLAALVQLSGPDVQDAAIGLATASWQRLLLFAALGQGVKDQPAVVRAAKTIGGELADQGIQHAYPPASYPPASLPPRPPPCYAIPPSVREFPEATPSMLATPAPAGWQRGSNELAAVPTIGPNRFGPVPFFARGQLALCQTPTSGPSAAC